VGTVVKQSYYSQESVRTGSVRTALVLALVALGSFVAIILAQCHARPVIALGVLGLMVIGLPLAAVLARDRP